MKSGSTKIRTVRVRCSGVRTVRTEQPEQRTVQTGKSIEQYEHRTVQTGKSIEQCEHRTVHAEPTRTVRTVPEQYEHSITSLIFDVATFVAVILSRFGNKGISQSEKVVK